MPFRDVSTAYVGEARSLAANARQLEAYDSGGNCVVLAGPGSGKTKTLTLKLARMLSEDVRPPQGVACITYSQECARELERRLDKLGLRDANRLYVGTLHGFCTRFLLRPFGRLANLPLPHNAVVATDAQRRAAFSTAATRLHGPGRPPFDLGQIESHRRVHVGSVAAMRADNEIKANLSQAYLQVLRGQGLIDYDDIVVFGHWLVTRHAWVRAAVCARFPILAVDEYQDLGAPLDGIVRALVFAGGARLFAVGDVDQTIYGFAGAQPHLLENLAAEDAVQTVRLDLNYRSADALIQASEGVLQQRRGYRSNDPNRPAVVKAYERAGGLADQAAFIADSIIDAALRSKRGRPPGEIAVLYPTADVGQHIADALDERAVPYCRNDNKAPYRPVPLTSWIEDAARWSVGGWRGRDPTFASLWKRLKGFREAQLGDREDSVAAQKLMEFLWASRQDGEAEAGPFVRALMADVLRPIVAGNRDYSDQMVQVRRLTEALETGGVMEGISLKRLAGRDTAPDRVNLLTLHSAKGCEFDVVAMMGLDHGILPWLNVDQARMQESRRLFYVGLTRARDEAHLVFSGWYERFGQRVARGPSPFLAELLESGRVELDR